MAKNQKAPVQLRTNREEDRMIKELKEHMSNYSFKPVTTSDVIRFALKRLHEELIKK